MNNHVNSAIVILRVGGGSRGTPVPSSPIQFRITAFAAMTKTTSRSRTYFKQLLQTVTPNFWLTIKSINRITHLDFCIS